MTIAKDGWDRLSLKEQELLNEFCKENGIDPTQLYNPESDTITFDKEEFLSAWRYAHGEWKSWIGIADTYEQKRNELLRNVVLADLKDFLNNDKSSSSFPRQYGREALVIHQLGENPDKYIQVEKIIYSEAVTLRIRVEVV